MAAKTKLTSTQRERLRTLSRQSWLGGNTNPTMSVLERHGLAFFESNRIGWGYGSWSITDAGRKFLMTEQDLG